MEEVNSETTPKLLPMIIGILGWRLLKINLIVASSSSGKFRVKVKCKLITLIRNSVVGSIPAVG